MGVGRYNWNSGATYDIQCGDDRLRITVRATVWESATLTLSSSEPLAGVSVPSTVAPSLVLDRRVREGRGRGWGDCMKQPYLSPGCAASEVTVDACKVGSGVR
jgi:hypothetical protein